MKCKNCGFENDRRWLEAVVPPPYVVGFVPDDDPSAPVDFDASIRWACAKCRRYHHKDGSLWKNTFSDAGIAALKHRAAYFASAEACAVELKEGKK